MQNIQIECFLTVVFLKLFKKLSVLNVPRTFGNNIFITIEILNFSLSEHTTVSHTVVVKLLSYYHKIEFAVCAAVGLEDKRDSAELGSWSIIHRSRKSERSKREATCKCSMLNQHFNPGIVDLTHLNPGTRNLRWGNRYLSLPLHYEYGHQPLPSLQEQITSAACNAVCISIHAIYIYIYIHTII